MLATRCDSTTHPHSLRPHASLPRDPAKSADRAHPARLRSKRAPRQRPSTSDGDACEQANGRGVAGQTRRLQTTPQVVSELVVGDPTRKRRRREESAHPAPPSLWPEDGGIQRSGPRLNRHQRSSAQHGTEWTHQAALRGLLHQLCGGLFVLTAALLLSECAIDT